MSERISKSQLMIPVYINEKIVLDMLAIIEDGFSMVSQVNVSQQQERQSEKKLDANVSTSSTLLSKLLKINLDAGIVHSSGSEQKEKVAKEKVHTNVSLLSKFRKTLEKEQLLENSFDISKIKVGDFIEIEGELQKNPLIDYMDQLIGVFHMIEIFSDEPELGKKKNTADNRKKDNKIFSQIKQFNNELKNSGTIDFVLSDQGKTVVLSVQEQYLANDNVSELLGGRFKVLGKVIGLRKSTSESIDLLRKTTLSILNDDTLNEMFSGFNSEDMKQFNLPELKTKINGPALIVIPIAIYA